MMTDPIADLLTRVRNAQRAGHKLVRTRASKLGERVLQVMKDEGFIASFERVKDRDDAFDEFEIVLKYWSTGEAMIRRLERVSKPGCRVYAGSEEIPRVDSGLGISIVSTSQGVLSDREARKRKIGGEILALVG